MAVFFARIANEGGRDLAVLCGWEHGGQIVNGTSYAAEFYRIGTVGPKIAVTPLTDLNKRFITSDMHEVNEHRKWIRTSTPAFTTVAEVTQLLSKMGLPQQASQRPRSTKSQSHGHIDDCRVAECVHRAFSVSPHEEEHRSPTC